MLDLTLKKNQIYFLVINSRKCRSATDPQGVDARLNSEKESNLLFL